MASGQLQSIGDFESYYGMDSLLDYAYGSGKENDYSIERTKTDAPILTSTTGYFNREFGAIAWNQLNERDTLFGLLPKAAWNRSGWRAITARAGTAGQGGVAENGALMDSVKPTMAQISFSVKTAHLRGEVSQIQRKYANDGIDDSWGSDAQLMAEYANTHKYDINEQMNTTVNTLASNNFESIDRVVSAYAEIASHSLDAGDADIYGIDRDAAASWADAQFSHNSNVQQSLTDSLIRGLISDTEAARANVDTQLWYTGFDTYSDLMGLYQDQARYNAPHPRVRLTMNGVESARGSDIGLEVQQVYGRPVFKDNTAVTDDKSRLYLLDTGNPEGADKPRLGIDVFDPTAFLESRDPFVNSSFIDQFMYRTRGELMCRFFAVQGKLVDL